MKTKDIIKVVAVMFIAPVVIGGAIRAVAGTINGVLKFRHNRMIKKGLKNGSIVEEDGTYYNVVEA